MENNSRHIMNKLTRSAVLKCPAPALQTHIHKTYHPVAMLQIKKKTGGERLWVHLCLLLVMSGQPVITSAFIQIYNPTRFRSLITNYLYTSLHHLA